MPRPASPDPSGTGPSATLRSQQVEATRRAVLDAARSAFGRNGYAQTSVDEIASAARVTKGAVYHHFEGKEALFRAVHAEVEADALARAQAVTDGSEASTGTPIDQIVARVSAYLDAALDDEIRRVTLIDGPAVLGLEAYDPAQQEASHAGMQSFLAAAVQRGEIGDFDPGVLTHLIRGLALLGGLLIARSGDREATRAELGRAIDAMVRGLGPERG